MTSPKRTPRGDAVRKAKLQRDAKVRRAANAYLARLEKIGAEYRAAVKKAQELPNG